MSPGGSPRRRRCGPALRAHGEGSPSPAHASAAWLWYVVGPSCQLLPGVAWRERCGSSCSPQMARANGCMPQPWASWLVIQSKESYSLDSNCMNVQNGLAAVSTASGVGLLVVSGHILLLRITLPVRRLPDSGWWSLNNGWIFKNLHAK